MSIVIVVQKWEQYMLGRHFITQIDWKCLKFFLEQHEPGRNTKKNVMQLYLWLSTECETNKLELYLYKSLKHSKKLH